MAFGSSKQNNISALAIAVASALTVSASAVQAQEEAAVEEKDVEKVVVKMLSPQKSVRTVCERLGFRVDAVVPDYARDREGNLQSLLIMSCTLDAWWREMKDFHNESSWPDG